MRKGRGEVVESTRITVMDFWMYFDFVYGISVDV